MRTFARVLVAILALVVGGGPALDGCLVSCHDPIGDMTAGSAHCHEATAESATLRIVPVSGCSHDHDNLTASAGELQPSSKASPQPRPEATMRPALSQSILAAAAGRALATDRTALVPIPLRI